MEKKLLAVFYRGFWFVLCVMIALVVTFLVISIVTWISFANDQGNIMWSILSTAMLLVFAVLSFKSLMPYFKDMKFVKEKSFNKMLGTVIKYRKKVLGGEPPTTDYYPIFKDLATGLEIELHVEGTKINETYNVLYLINTKIAVIEKAQETI